MLNQNSLPLFVHGRTALLLGPRHDASALSTPLRVLRCCLTAAEASTRMAVWRLGLNSLSGLQSPCLITFVACCCCTARHRVGTILNVGANTAIYDLPRYLCDRGSAYIGFLTTVHRLSSSGFTNMLSGMILYSRLGKPARHPRQERAVGITISRLLKVPGNSHTSLLHGHATIPRCYGSILGQFLGRFN